MLSILSSCAHFAPAVDADFPFVTLSPLSPAGSFWFFLHRRLDLLIGEVAEHYPVDPDLVYLAGVSIGGMGVWSLAMAFPKRFAAAAPIAGGTTRITMIESDRHYIQDEVFRSGELFAWFLKQ